MSDIMAGSEVRMKIEREGERDSERKGIGLGQCTGEGKCEKKGGSEGEN